MTIPPALRPGFAIIRDGDPVPAKLRGMVVAIGNFDGVHRGHRAAIDIAKVRAGQKNSSVLALTFEPHPRTFFKPDEPVFRLSPEPLKVRLFANAGLDGAILMTFNASLAQRPAEEFISEILVRRFGVRGVVVNRKAVLARPEVVDELHAVGARVVVYTLNDDAQWDAVTSLGVDGIVTDDPATLSAWQRAAAGS